VKRRTRRKGGCEFRPGIGVRIIDGAGDINQPGSDQREQMVLIDRERIRDKRVAFMAFTKPMGKIPIDFRDAFSLGNTAKGCSIPA
jgi:hypothetical protein